MRRLPATSPARISHHRNDGSRVRALLLAGLALTGVATAAEPPHAPRVVVLRDDLPVLGAAVDPDALAEALGNAGIAPTFLDSRQLAQPALLNRAECDVLVLPYGPMFPVGAAANFREFLRAGGKFLSLGGYAFDNLVERVADSWQPLPQTTDPAESAWGSAAWFYEIPADELRATGRLTFTGHLRTRDIAGPGFAHLSVYQIAADGSLPMWRDLCKVRGSTDWHEVRYSFALHPRAKTLSLRAGLYHCRGTAWFDDIRLEAVTGPAVCAADFEPPFAPGTQATKQWWPSHPVHCALDAAQARSGSQALRTALESAPPHIERLNTRYGRPADGLDVDPTQLGVFQADYPLERVAAATAAPLQSVLPTSLRIEGPLDGWSACGVVGWNHARWIPLLDAVDRFGRRRGTAGALLRHYAGPWAGSSWAFFGVTNRNLFDPVHPLAAQALSRIVADLARDTYVAALMPDRGCYRAGEPVTLEATLFNGGRVEQHVRLVLDIAAGAPDGPEADARISPVTTPETVTTEVNRESRRMQANPVASSPVEFQPVPPYSRLFASIRGSRPEQTLETNIVLAPHRPRTVRLSWQPPASPADFYHVLARLSVGPEEIDRAESGFICQNAATIAQGPRLGLHGNYIEIDDRPRFLFGTDDWSYTFTTHRETPLEWLRDMRQRRDFGVLLYENLQFGLPQSASERETRLRQVDGLVQLAQKHGQVYMAGLLIGYNVAVSDSELERQADWCREVARRYRQVPGFVHYINGDYRCEPDSAVMPLWNRFLRQRYTNDPALHAAWGDMAPSEPIGAIPIEDLRPADLEWNDRSAADRLEFETELTRRWNHTLVRAIRTEDPAHPITGEFYQLPVGGVDLPAAIDELDWANFGFFDRPGADLARFPALCKFNDRRARGKPFGPGEYGVKTHPAWADGRDHGYHIARTPEQAVDLFLGVAHYALGLGASRIQNWCWKDDAHRVFPWGMIYPCDGVPKPTAYAHRNQSLLFRHFQPVYTEPRVWVLMPDAHRLGGGQARVHEGILTSFNLALANRFPGLGTLTEADPLPASARLIYYPLPYCPPDDVCARLEAWVRQGGVLYLSGDISFDPQRRRTRTARFESLCGVRFRDERRPPLGLDAANPADQPVVRVEPLDARVLAVTENGAPLETVHALGQGHVLFCADPVELHSVPARRARDVALYRRAAELARITRLDIEPDDPRLDVFRVPLRDGGQVDIVFNTDTNSASRAVTLPNPGGPLTFDVSSRRPALIWRDAASNVRALEIGGVCRRGSTPLLSDTTSGIVIALDGLDLAASRALLLLPLRPGRIAWEVTRGWRDAVIETGEICNGRWQPYETRPLESTADQARVTVDPDQAAAWLLVTEPEQLPRWRTALESSP